MPKFRTVDKIVLDTCTLVTLDAAGSRSDAILSLHLDDQVRIPDIVASEFAVGTRRRRSHRPALIAHRTSFLRDVFGGIVTLTPREVAAARQLSQRMLSWEKIHHPKSFHNARANLPCRGEAAALEVARTNGGIMVSEDNGALAFSKTVRKSEPDFPEATDTTELLIAMLRGALRMAPKPPAVHGRRGDANYLVHTYWGIVENIKSSYRGHKDIFTRLNMQAFSNSAHGSGFCVPPSEAFAELIKRGPNALEEAIQERTHRLEEIRAAFPSVPETREDGLTIAS